VQKILLIAFGAGLDGWGERLEFRGASFRGKLRGRRRMAFVVQGSVGDNAAEADVLARQFELGLD